MTPLCLHKDETLVLASGSPRRKELLAEAGIPFACIPADIDEDAFHDKRPERLVARLAAEKSLAVARKSPSGTLILAADTVVVSDGRIFGKPDSMDQAADMLRSLSGHPHAVLTGVSIRRTGTDGAHLNWTCTTDVFFKTLNTEDIRAYHALVNPLDKAGAYAIQEHGDLVVHRIEGYRSNVVGLPIEQVKDVLAGRLEWNAPHSLERPLPHRLKDTAEFFLALLLLAACLPLLALIALLVRISSKGPILYKARRLGQNGSTFSELKFRTMCRNADEALPGILDQHPDMNADWLRTRKLPQDPRITPLGKFLRKTSLDELPQLWNILKGDMALVGPRPIKAAEIPKYGAQHTIIQHVKPGLTGLWQVSGRSRLTYEQRIELDRTYIQNWTPLLDATILLKTIPEVFLGKGAF